MPTIWHGVSRLCWRVTRKAVRQAADICLNTCHRLWLGWRAMRAVWLRSAPGSTRAAPGSTRAAPAPRCAQKKVHLDVLGTAQVADARHDILTALLADRPATALHLVDEILAGKSDAPSALRDWRDDLAVWRTLSPVMARFRDAHAGNAQNARETE